MVVCLIFTKVANYPGFDIQIKPLEELCRGRIRTASVGLAVYIYSS